jgi:hypothetical protein
LGKSGQPAALVNMRWVAEMPWRGTQSEQSAKSRRRALLSRNPEAGLLQAAGARPTSDSIHAVVAVDLGAAFANAAEGIGGSATDTVVTMRDALHLSGDQQSDNDALLLSGDQQDSGGDKLILSSV